MKNLFTPEENMILTIDYYVDRLLHEKFVAAINLIDLEREDVRQKFEQTGDIHTWERLIYLDGKIAGIEEIFRIIKGETK